jgi:6,7-dimethyl-8-ribityllumazine synthase
MSLEQVNVIEGSKDASGLRFAVVVARFNAFVTEKMAEGAVDALRRQGASPGDITLVRVAGAFEIPAAAAAMVARADIDAVVTIGCLIRGDTIHFDLIATECTRGLGELTRTTLKPVTLGVITTENLEQAHDRAGGKAGNKGAEAALAALEQIGVLNAARRQN